MSLKKTTIASLMAAGLVASSASFAQGMKPADTGLYIGGSVGQSMADCNASGGSCDDKDVAYKVFGGYQFNRNLAAELGYSQLGEWSSSFPGGSVNLEANVWDLVGVGMWPLNQQFSISRKLGLRLEWQRYSGLESPSTTGGGVTVSGESDIDVLSLGVLWKF